MGNFGNYLSERRRNKGITIEYISLNTALNENVLNALENENYAFFNSPFYFTNFLNTYLDFLEIDRERFYTEFSEELEFLKKKENVILTQSMTGLRYSKFRNRKLIFRAILLGIVLAVIIYLTFINKGLLFSLFEPEEIRLPDTGIQMTGIPEYEADFSPVNIVLTFSDDCWARISKGKEIVEEKVFTSGERLLVKGYDIKLIIGNPGAVDLTVNGTITGKYKGLSGTAVIHLTPDSIDRILNWNH